MAPRTSLETAATATQREAGVQLHLWAHSQVFRCPAEDRHKQMKQVNLMIDLHQTLKVRRRDPQANGGAQSKPYQCSPSPSTFHHGQLLPVN